MSSILFWIWVTLVFPTGISVIFKPEKEYEYVYSSSLRLVDVDDFNISAKVLLNNIDQDDTGHEVHLRIESFKFESKMRKAQDEQSREEKLDLSGWFSFIMTDVGEVTRTYYHADEDPDVLAVKKGIVNLLSGRFLDQREAHRIDDDGNWFYDTTENGHEGEHNATYKVKTTSTGRSYTKRRTHCTNVPAHAKSSFVKNVMIDEVLGTIHSITSKEHVEVTNKTLPGFDPYKGLRHVTPVSDFKDIEMPGMRVESAGKLVFVRVTDNTDRPQKPPGAVAQIFNYRTSYKGQNLRYHRSTSREDTLKLLQNIEDKMNCIRNQPSKGSQQLLECYSSLVETMLALPDEQVILLVDRIFKRKDNGVVAESIYRSVVLDCLFMMDTPLSQKLILNYTLEDRTSDPELFRRSLFHLVTMNSPPSEDIFTFAAKIIETDVDTLYKRYGTDDFHIMLLAFGSLSRKASHCACGDVFATKFNKKIKNLLGLHDPYIFRMKRSSMTVEQALEYDWRKVVYLEALGNEGHESSFEHIVSHINCTISSVIKRASIHALRNYNHSKAAESILMTINEDESAEVRHDAILAYQAHPAADMKIVWRFNRSQDIDPHSRKKRGFRDAEFKWRLEVPGVDYRRLVGTKELGAAFGVVMLNYFDLRIAPLSGHVKIEIHDEVYARAIIGILGVTFDFFSARVCFKGGTEYNLNILQEYDPRLTHETVRLLTKGLKEVATAIKTGIDLMNEIISERFSLNLIIEDFIQAFKELPKMVLGIREAAVQAIEDFGNLVQENIPLFLRPMKELIDYVSKLMSDIKLDVMDFFYTLVQAVETTIPKAGKLLYKSVKGIIQEFPNLFKDPKTSVARIGGGVVGVAFSIKQLETVKDRITNLALIKGKKPYWMEFDDIFENVKSLTNTAFQSMVEGAGEWIEGVKTSDDVLTVFTGGKMSQETIRRMVVERIYEIIDRLLAPLENLKNIGNGFLDKVFKVYDLITDVKEGFGKIKAGYKAGRTLIDKVFGPKFDGNFPKLIRESDSCPQSGFYPSKIDSYEYEGVDLVTEEGSEIVAPLTAVIQRTQREGEARLTDITELPTGHEILIQNIELDEKIGNPDDSLYIERRVSAGEKIGIATGSRCTNHIHLVLLFEGKVVDPSRLLAPRPPVLPEWKQYCNDKRVVLKGDTIVASPLVEGIEVTDTSESLPDDGERPQNLDPNQELTVVGNEMYHALKTSQTRKKRSFIQTTDSSAKNAEFANKFMIRDPQESDLLDLLVTQIEAFLDNFSIRRIKLGPLVDFLQSHGMTESVQKVRETILKIKVAVDDARCLSPSQMTDDFLQTQLINRGLPASGDRKTNIGTLTKPDKRCPYIAMAMKKTANMQCFYTNNCLEMQCCVSYEIIGILQHTYKAFFRVDINNYKLYLGFNEWRKDISFAVDRYFPTSEDIFDTGIKFELLDSRLMCKYNLETSSKRIILTFGCGICSQIDENDCLAFIYLIENAEFPLPEVLPNGTIVITDVDFESYFAKERIKEQLEESAESLLEEGVAALADKIREELGIPEGLLKDNPRCNIPSNMEDDELKEELTERGLSVDGTRDVLENRLVAADTSCTTNTGSTTHLPKVEDEDIKKIFTYTVSKECMRIDACLDVHLPFADVIKSFTAAIELDPCDFKIYLEFENFNKSVWLIGYNWGGESFFRLTDEFYLRYKLDKNEDEFIITVALVGELINFDSTFIDSVHIPIPVCNENFKLPGAGDLYSFAVSIGGNLSQEAFEVFTKAIGIDGILQNKKKCTLPPGPENCDTDVTDFIHPDLQEIFQCKMLENCWGVHCCLEFDFDLPFSDTTIDVSLPFVFKYNPCQYSVELEIGNDYKMKRWLVEYEWDEVNTLTIGKGAAASIIIRYTIGKEDIGFVVDVQMDICLPLKDKQYCVPQNTKLHLLENEIIRTCTFSKDGSYHNEYPDFSLTEWLTARGREITDTVGEAGREFIIETFNLHEFMMTTSCDRTRPPYSPSVKGWNIECSLSHVLNLDLPETVKCHVASDCKKISCCVDIPQIGFSVQLSFDIDLCQNKIIASLEKISSLVESALSDFKWGEIQNITIAKVFQLSYSIRKPAANIYTVDADFKACFERSGACLVDKKLLKDLEIPKFFCRPTNKVDEILSNTTHQCSMDADLQGITCLTNANIQPNMPGTNTYIRIDTCKNWYIYSVNDKRWESSLSSVQMGMEYHQTVKDGITLFYIIDESSTSYSVDLGFEVCQDGQTQCEKFTVLFAFPLYKANCSAQVRRKRRSSKNLEYSDIQQDLQELYKSKLSNKEINEALKDMKLQEEILRAEQFETSHIDDSDQETKALSLLKSLGKFNPMALVHVNENTDWGYIVEVKGGQTILDILNDTTAAVGNANQLFVPGNGLTEYGVRLLGRELANMTIGDLESFLELNIATPAVIHDIIMDLNELAKALYAETTDKIFSGRLENAFDAFDVSLRGHFTYPLDVGTLFSVPVFIIPLGPVLIVFEFGGSYFLGLDIGVGLRVMSMVSDANITPNAGIRVWGGASIGFVLYAEIRLTGYILDIRFPTYAELDFSRFPITLGLKMDLEMIPIRMQLTGLVTIRIKIPFIGTIRKTIFRATLWSYVAPSINKNIIDNIRKEEDTSPPTVSSLISNNEGYASSIDSCLVYQVPNLDYTEPSFQILVAAEDDKSQLKFFLDVGTYPGGTDTLEKFQLGGTLTKLSMSLKHTGVPLYFTLHIQNSQGLRSTVTCYLHAYDVTVPTGRVTADFFSSSNPHVLGASIVVLDEYNQTQTDAAIGYGEEIYGDQIVAWHAVQLTEVENDHVDETKETVLEYFSGSIEGKVVGDVLQSRNGVSSVSQCAHWCLTFEKHSCLSFNYDFGTSGVCEVLKAVQGHDHVLVKEGLFVHYERLYTGHTVEVRRKDLNLQHNHLYIINLHTISSLGYSNIISSKGVLTDFYPPEPGFINNTKEDYLENVPCESLIPDNRQDLRRYCIGANHSLPNHRVIIDGRYSRTVFNGMDELVDQQFTRINRYISANWDGFHDNETSIRAYTWAVGRKYCDNIIHPYHDPQTHLSSKLQWKNQGLIHPIPPPYTKLPDGSYYITVRALNGVEYGGPLALTVCHTTPYIVDTSPPFVHEIYNIRYDELSYFIYADIIIGDPHSGISEYDVCLGKTSHDCNVMSWNRYDYEKQPKVSLRRKLPDGIPTWLRIRAVNKVKMTTVGVADQPLLVDTSGPIAGIVYDGSVFQTDQEFSKVNRQICANWENFYDPDSGISSFFLGVGTSLDLTDVIQLQQIGPTEHKACIHMSDENTLMHGSKYYSTVYGLNNGIVKRNTSATSNGVTIDLTPPISGQIVDGTSETFVDMSFSSSDTTVSSQWTPAADQESGIFDYLLSVENTRHGENTLLKNWVSLGPNTEKVVWRNFHLKHGDFIQTTLKVINGAGNTVQRKTDGFLVDLTPPQLKYIRDGETFGVDKRYQSNANRLAVSFAIEDVESGLRTLKFKIHQEHNGIIQHFWPVDNDWYTEIHTSIELFHTEDLNLTHGAKYTFILAAENNAGITSTHESNGVTLDISPPSVKQLHVGVLYGELEDEHEGYVYQADHEGIKISYLAVDPQSGIKDVIIRVGTSKGLDDIKSSTSYGSSERDIYVNDIQLTDTDPNTMSPIYYVTLQVKNGAGELSAEIYSTPIVVVPEDVSGIVVDGVTQSDDIFLEDIDYTTDDTTMETTFNGFKSILHGIKRFVWAVGTSPNLEDIMPFTDSGLTFEEKLDTKENGKVYSGTAHLPVKLEHGKLYFVTMRGITHSGQALQAVTDGIMIDKTPPSVQIERVLDHDIIGKDMQIYYEMSSESLSGSWNHRDSEVISPDVVDNIGMVYAQTGTFPGGSDVQHVTYWLSPITDKLEVADVEIARSGLPNFISVTVENKCGLRSTVVSPAVVVDRTAPEAGEIHCSNFVQPKVPIQCHWSGFFDAESPITLYKLYIGFSPGEDDLLPPVIIEKTVLEHTVAVAMNIESRHGDVLYATVVAENGVNKEIRAYSEPIFIDTTPPKPGLVLALDHDHIVGNRVSSQLNGCNTDRECMKHNVVCHHSFTSMTVWWSSFVDEESGISAYYLAIGTTERNTDVLDFEEVFGEAGDRAYTVTGLNLYGIEKIYVKIMAINGIGLSSISTSSGIYLSYISQGLDPLSPIGIWDSDPGVVGDIDVQSDSTTITAEWDITGEPCPVEKFEWKIERLDGSTVQEFTDTQGSKQGFNDQLTLRDGETYFSRLRVTNVDGYRYELYSDGVTIQSHPLVKGWVFDGDITGYDLNILSSTSIVNCNWNGFGNTLSTDYTGAENDETELLDSQVISHYEVALGTDRRFPSTRTNIVPFTNVGKNTSHTFTALDLVPGTARYYCTVKAYSTSLSTAQVTSNGFYVSYNGGVSPGNVNVKKFTDSQTKLEFIWNNFTSLEGMMMYYVAVSSYNNLTMVECNQHVDGRIASEEEKDMVFDIKNVTNVGDDNFASLQDLYLRQGHVYHIFVIGVDRTGACNITAATTVIDVTEPDKGFLTGGPYYNMYLSYTSENSVIKAKWSGYQDSTSGIKSYSISLWQGLSCENDENRTQITEEYTLPNYEQTFTFRNLNLSEGTPYFVKLVVENGAGLVIMDTSEPILLDTSLPVAGRVVEGTDFKKDITWWGSTTEFKGTILHYQSPSGLPCPVQNLSITDVSWSTLESTRLSDNTGLVWNIIYKPQFISTTNQPGILKIKMARDSKSANMISGGYWRFADFANTSSYQFSIKAASEEIPTDNNVVTEILFTDNAIDSSFTTYNYKPGIDWTDEDCSCCFSENQTESCSCSDCSTYLYNIRSPERQRADNSTGNQKPTCGFQIYAGLKPFGIIWCKFAEATLSEMEMKVNLPEDVSESFIDYKLDFYTAKDDAVLQLCLKVFAENTELGSLCGIPYLSPSANCLVHVLNRNMFLPEREDELFTWTVYAEVKNIIFPPPSGDLCRYGEPFRGGNIPIVRYEAAIGSEPGLSDTHHFEEVNHPCIPCTDACSQYKCDAACNQTAMTQVHFTIQHLNLQALAKGDNVSSLGVNYLTVKAVLGSGRYITASSNGFYVDTSPPTFDNDTFFYFDVDQGEFTPVDYQGSNRTIKAVWLCTDEQSEITEYHWAIGSEKGLQDIQPFSSTGLNPLGISDDLEGILENNATYYITVKCRNEAGLETTFIDSKGVTVVTEAPDPDAVGGSIIAAEEFDYEVYPSNARKTNNPTSVGATWEISSDSKVKRYEFCLGSRDDRPGDIFPCTWVGYNVSGEVTIENGCLMSKGEKLYDLNELIANISASSTGGTFTMEPGRVIFVSVRICYEPVKCSYKHLGTVTIVTVNTTESGVSDGKNRIKISTTTQPKTRKKRSVTDVDVEVITPPALPEGETLLLISLTEDDFAKEYTSSASREFVSYIIDPNATYNATERILVGRLQKFIISFAVVSVGQIEMPGPLQISFTQLNANPAPGESIYELIHWHTADQEWKMTSLTCQFETDHVTQNTMNSTTTVKVCSTRQNGDVKELYFKEETQFAVALILAHAINNVPFLVSPTNLTFYEDQVGGYVYQLLGHDIDGDEIGFQLMNVESDNSSIVQSIEISTNGTLFFQVCNHCSGTFSTLIQIFDIPTSSGIPGNFSYVSLNITIEPVNDPPNIFLVDDKKGYLLHSDITEEVQVFRDNEVGKDTYFTAIVGAYDYDVGDILDVVHSVVSEEYFSVQVFTSSYQSILNCNDDLCLGEVPERSPAENEWVFARVTYKKDTNFSGIDTVKLAVKDSSGTLSDIVTISVYNLEFPCLNGGLCAAKTDLQCDSASRLTNFDDNFICSCTPSWTGTHCESDVNECETHDCDALKKCVNSPGSFSCEYSIYFYLLVGGVPFLVFVVIVTGGLYLKCSRQPIRAHNEHPPLTIPTAPDEMVLWDYNDEFPFVTNFGNSPIKTDTTFTRNFRPTTSIDENEVWRLSEFHDNHAYPTTSIDENEVWRQSEFHDNHAYEHMERRRPDSVVSRLGVQLRVLPTRSPFDNTG